MKTINYLMVRLILISSCKKDKEVDPCEEIECNLTSVNINNKEYTFHHSEIGTAHPEYINFLIYNVLFDYDDLDVETISVWGQYPLVLGKQELKDDAVHYFVKFNDPTNLDDTRMINSYDNWVEITQICDRGYSGTVHFQLEVSGSGKSFFYHADTLNVHFDFSICK